jgi:TetR/AcrR family transcriptional regulator
MAKRTTHNNVPRPDLSTEQKILDAARQEFCEQGLDGSRMQAIANRAGVNKALLHYYFRSKDKLFEIIIREVVTAIWRQINADLSTQPQPADFRSAIRSIVSSYIMVFSTQPELPVILIRQLLSRGGDARGIAKYIIHAVGDGPLRIAALFQKEMKAGTIIKTDPVQLMVSIMGMILFTFLSQPIAKAVEKETGFIVKYDNVFYKARINFITDMVFEGIMAKEPLQ